MIRSLCSWSNTAKTKLTSLLVSVTVARNSGNCNLIRSVDCYGYTCNYNPKIVTNKNKYFN